MHPAELKFKKLSRSLFITSHLFIIVFTLFLIGCDPENIVPEDKKPENNIAFFDIEAFPEIFLEISTTEWNDFLSYYDLNPKNEEYIKCDFSIKNKDINISLDNCGLRLKGNTSRRRPEGSKDQMHNPKNPDWHHASFSVKFNRFVAGQKISNIDRINLKWFKDDAMYVREVYCYDLFERYGVWTAPQSSYTRLKLKIREDKDTVYYGVYQIQEPVNIDYLKSRKEQFGDADGFLWKANWGADFRKPNSSLMNVENVTLESVYTPVYDLKTNTENLFGAQQVLMSFITNLNTKTGNDFKAWISAAIDVPLFLKTYAVSVLCGMWDDYWMNKNNFYFYFNSHGKFFFIPFDYDNTLGTSLIMKDSGRQDLLNWGNSSYPLVKKIIDIPEYRALYISYIRELCNKENDLFHHSKSTTRIANWHNMIRNHISNDTGEDMEIEDKPASWGNCGFYRLQGNSNNYFQIRAANIP